jgi:hypothetical protein
MFPGYLLARFDLTEMHRSVLYVHGVSGIVRFGNRYPTIEEATLAQLRAQTGFTEVKELILMDFLGRKMEAEVEHASVLPRVTHPLAA